MLWLRWAAAMAVGVLTMDASAHTNAPTPILLSSLHPAQLESVLDARLARLSGDILTIYQDQLRKHDDTVDKIQRVRRDAYYPSPPDDLWHSFIYNTGVGNRKVVEVEGVDRLGHLGPVRIVEVFPLNLPDLSAVYKGYDGRAYVEVDGRLEELKLHNNWTISSTGCDCGDGYKMASL
ncbi:uncharacterized protein LOC121874176 [Homarus americanus]|uniref:uncharacterized protein LOC121874176 n=1 Tax=Homarus americanus TaxID=6706 RepID=UPI001C463742|nr:uncharacterized protein LOC121874176 [Homarus americanus]